MKNCSNCGDPRRVSRFPCLLVKKIDSDWCLNCELTVQQPSTEKSYRFKNLVRRVSVLEETNDLLVQKLAPFLINQQSSSASNKNNPDIESQSLTSAINKLKRKYTERRISYPRPIKVPAISKLKRTLKLKPKFAMPVPGNQKPVIQSACCSAIRPLLEPFLALQRQVSNTTAAPTPGSSATPAAGPITIRWPIEAIRKRRHSSDW